MDLSIILVGFEACWLVYAKVQSSIEERKLGRPLDVRPASIGVKLTSQIMLTIE